MKVIAAIFGTINEVCSLVPGIVWALVCVAMFAQGLSLQHKLTSAREDAKEARTAYGTLDSAMKTQKAAAQSLYDTLKAKADALQANINEMRRAQEITDENHKAEKDAAARALAAVRARNDGRLRDPWATGCRGGGAGAEGGAGPGAGSGGENAAEAGGLLSAQLSQRLDDRAAEADAVNLAYSSCRAALYRDRGLAVPADNDPH